MIDCRGVVPIKFVLDLLPVVLSFAVVLKVLFDKSFVSFLMLGKQFASQADFDIKSICHDELPRLFVVIAESVAMVGVQGHHDFFTNVACRRTTGIA